MASAKAQRNDPHEAEGQNPIGSTAARPGATKSASSMHFEGLGNIDDFPEPASAKTAEGSGTQCVVISDVLSGADGEVYQKGQIHRISKLVHAYDADDKDFVKSQIKRLVTLGAIRRATTEEIEQGFADVTAESESEATNSERLKRIEAEEESARLRRELATLKGEPVGQEPLAPGTKEKDPFNED